MRIQRKEKPFLDLEVMMSVIRRRRKASPFIDVSGNIPSTLFKTSNVDCIQSILQIGKLNMDILHVQGIFHWRGRMWRGLQGWVRFRLSDGRAESILNRIKTWEEKNRHWMEWAHYIKGASEMENRSRGGTVCTEQVLQEGSDWA